MFSERTFSALCLLISVSFQLTEDGRRGHLGLNAQPHVILVNNYELENAVIPNQNMVVVIAKGATQ